MIRSTLSHNNETIHVGQVSYPRAIQKEVLEVVEHFTYLGSCITSDCLVTDEVNARICKARTAFANSRHLWGQSGLSLNLKGRVYQATLRAVLLYGCETWPIRAAELRRLQEFDNGCLRTLARVGWCRQIRNEAVRKRVLGCVTGASIEECVHPQKLCWLGYVLRMPNHPVAPLRCLAAMPHEGGTRAGILSGRPSLDRGSREAEIGFEPRTSPSVNSRSYHSVHLAPSSAYRLSVLTSCCLAAMPPEGSRRPKILAGCPTPEKRSRDVLREKESAPRNLFPRDVLSTVRAVLLYGCETWPIRAAELRRLQVFDNRCLRTIALVIHLKAILRRKEYKWMGKGLSARLLKSFRDAYTPKTLIQASWIETDNTNAINVDYQPYLAVSPTRRSGGNAIPTLEVQLHRQHPDFRNLFHTLLTGHLCASATLDGSRSTLISSTQLIYDVLQLNVLHTGRLMIQLAQYSRYH
ncbi:hypothetical protein T265_12734, partial [Opisthorchis viverrini]